MCVVPVQARWSLISLWTHDITAVSVNMYGTSTVEVQKEPWHFNFTVRIWKDKLDSVNRYTLINIYFLNLTFYSFKPAYICHLVHDIAMVIIDWFHFHIGGSCKRGNNNAPVCSSLYSCFLLYLTIYHWLLYCMLSNLQRKQMVAFWLQV